MKFNMSKCMEAFSLALDFAEMDYFKINMHHSRRIAYIALCIGHALDLSEDERKDLYVLSLLHDNGLTLADMRPNERRFELSRQHCPEGEKNLLKIPLMQNRENVIKYHHENHNGSGFYRISGDDIPLFSQILRVADFMDLNFNLSNLRPEERKEVKKRVEENKGIFFSPRVVDAFLSFTHKERFWADLSFYNINDILGRVAPKIVYDFQWEDIIPISETFMRIIDCKSSFTYDHSKGITHKIDLMSDYYEFSRGKRLQLHIAANLHDLGKLYIPNAILEKNGKLDHFEFSEIKKHTYYTKLALDKIPFFENISNWAANHHEKLNGKGYPESLTADDLDFESRLMGVIDIYQALTEDRPYRKGLSHSTTVKKLSSMAQNGFIDPRIVGDVAQVMEDREIF